jgi:hypothetical protein
MLRARPRLRTLGADQRLRLVTTIGLVLAAFGVAAQADLASGAPTPPGELFLTSPAVATTTAGFSYSPGSPVTGSPVTFDAAASACGAPPCSYAWSDDGSPTRPPRVLYPLGTGQTMHFTFQGAGTKYVRLVVTDAAGRTPPSSTTSS